MKIDIAANIERADDLYQFVMKTYQHPAMYTFRYANGESAFCVYNPKEMEDFQPKKTVSEMMQIWKEGIDHQIETYENSLKTNDHPFYTHMVAPMASNLNLKYRWDELVAEGHTAFDMNFTIEHEVEDERYWYETPIKMTEEGREWVASKIPKLKERQGELTFIMFVL